MIAGIQRFLGELREAGVTVSPAEALDALRAVDGIGFERRESLHAALRCTLAKRRDDARRFDEVFERFFRAPGLAGAAGARRGEPSSAGAPSTTRRGTRGATPAEPARAEAAGDGARAPSAGREAPHRVRSETTPRSNPQMAALRDAVREGRRSAAPRLRRLGLQPGPRSAAGPAGRELRRPATVDDERELARAVPPLVERIRLGAGRRWRRSRRGRLYLRRLFRENMSHGGVPFLLPRRRSRPRRPRVLLLLDVSHSTARATALFLSIAAAFLQRLPRCRLMLFVDRAVPAGRAVERWLAAGPAQAPPDVTSRRRPAAGIERGGTGFDRVLEAVPDLNLEAASDYGRTFDGLLRGRGRPVGRDTLLLILGDGRINRFEPQAWCLDELASRCGASLWLVPEAFEEWGSGDSALGSYLPLVDTAVEARDLDGLARGVAELVRRL